MDACEAQGVEVPTWSSDGGFVTITFKRPFFKANTIETNGEDNRTSKRDNLRSTTAQVPTKFRSSSKNDIVNGRKLYDHEQNHGKYGVQASDFV